MPFITLDELQTRELVPGFWGKMVHTEGMTFSHWIIKAGAELPVHQHLHEQVSFLVEGTLEFTLDGITERIVPGKLVVIPSNVPHSAKALTDCVVIDVFQPVRDDYR